MMRVACHLFVLLFGLECLSQSTFNLIYDNGKRTELSFFAQEIDSTNTYLVTSSSFGGSLDQLQIHKVADDGTILDTLKVNIQDKHFFPENIVPTTDGNFVITGTLFQSNPYDGNCFAFKITPALDSLWLKEYEFRTGNEGSKKIKETFDKGFVIVAYSQTFPNNDAQNYIFKIDSAGNKEWEFIHGDSTHNEEPLDLIQLVDSSFLVVSWRVYPDDDNILLLKLSPSGQLIWEKELHSNRLTIATEIIPVSTTRAMLGGISRLSINGKSNAYAAMIDTAGNLKWEKYYGGSESGWFADGDILDAGHVVFAGNQSGIETYQNNRDGYVVKMDTSGNVIWSRLVNPTGKFEHEVDDYFYGVLATSDGGVLCTGFTFKGTISNTQDAWIMKLDSNGLCDTATCFPWLVSVIPNPEPAMIKVWPNPSAAYVNILLPKRAGTLKLYNLAGQQVLAKEVRSSREQLPVSLLSEGIYLLNWVEDGVVLGNRKVVIQR